MKVPNNLDIELLQNCPLCIKGEVLKHRRGGETYKEVFIYLFDHELETFNYGNNFAILACE